MNYLAQLRTLEEKKEIAGGGVPTKLTKPGFDGFGSALPPAKNILQGLRDQLADEDAVDPKQARRQAEVIKLLEARPEITRAYLANTLPDGTGVITLAVRGIGVCELLIAPDRYDALEVMQFLDTVMSVKA